MTTPTCEASRCRGDTPFLKPCPARAEFFVEEEMDYSQYLV